MDKKRIQKELEVLKQEVIEERDEVLGKLNIHYVNRKC